MQLTSKINNGLLSTEGMNKGTSTALTPFCLDIVTYCHVSGVHRSIVAVNHACLFPPHKSQTASNGNHAGSVHPRFTDSEPLQEDLFKRNGRVFPPERQVDLRPQEDTQ